MLPTRLSTPTVITYYLLLHPFFLFTSIFCAPYSSDDIIALHNYPDLDHNLVHPIPLSPPRASTSPTQKLQKSVLVFGRGNAIATGVIIVITLLNIIVYNLRKYHEANFDETLTVSSSSSIEQLCRHFSLAEIRLATKNFDDALVIGQGGFGKVYRGLIDKGARTVAVKRLKPMSNQGAPEFWTEIDMLSNFRHSHIISLIGYCENRHEMILVYEYMASGTFADHLHKITRNASSPLSWVQRLKICLGAARGLDYLHTGTGVHYRVIHRDVKSSNILLDENLIPKISDFGMSKRGPANQPYTHVSTMVKGTCGYLDPEYFLTHRLTRKADVYAFGVVLFEALCGRPAVDLRLDEEQRGLAGWARHCIKEGSLDQIIDPYLRGKILPNCLTAFAQIAAQCLYEHKKKRPTMAEVVAQLEYALALEEKNDSSIIEWNIFNSAGPHDNQKNDNSSSKQQEVINASNDGNHDDQIDEIIRLNDVSIKHSTVNHAKMTFTRKARLFFLGTTRGVSASPPPTIATSPTSTPVGNSATGAIAGGVAAAGPKIALAWWRRQRKPQYEEDPFVALGNRRFSLRELQVATDSFSNKNFLGSGVSSKVYKGRLADGSLVAVKRLKEGSLQFKMEVETSSMAVHQNLLQLQGICITPTEWMVVYPYMANGSVALCLRERSESQSPLNWLTRKGIALGAARGLAYLHDHCDPKIIHRNVKAANIFLDEEFEAVVGDFGLVKLMDHRDTHVSTAVRGTIGHIAPEYLSTGQSSEKTDVYGYGVMLLELITGQKAFDLARLANDDDVMLLDWVKGLMKEKKLEALVDNDLQGTYVDEEVEELIQLALLCTQNSPLDRPNMSEVVRMLEGDGLAERWELWQEEMFRQEYNTHHPNTDWIISDDSIGNLDPDELSGPR